jgi:hypothetical protein
MFFKLTPNDAIKERDSDLDPWNDVENEDAEAAGEHAEADKVTAIDVHAQTPLSPGR